MISGNAEKTFHLVRHSKCHRVIFSLSPNIAVFAGSTDDQKGLTRI